MNISSVKYEFEYTTQYYKMAILNVMQNLQTGVSDNDIAILDKILKHSNTVNINPHKLRYMILQDENII